MIKGAIFDVDGTLLDSMVMWRTFTSDIIRKYGGDPEDGVDEKVRYFSLRQTAEYLAENYIGVSADEGERICLTETMDFYKNRAQMKPGAVEFLTMLHEKGVKMYIATATYRPLIQAALERAGVWSYFSGMITCSEAGAGKTKPDVFLKALEALGTEIPETWVFEDAYHAVQTAKKIGLSVHCVYDPTEADHVKELTALADIYSKDFTTAKFENYL